MAQTIKNVVKYLLYLILLVVLFLYLLLIYVINSESGSHWAIRHAINFADIDLTYDSMGGKISNGLVINNLRYKDQTIDIKVNNIEYKSKWNWLNRHITLSEVEIDGVTITPLKATEAQNESQPFSGVELPLTIDLKQSTLRQLTLVSNEASNTFDLIELSALIEPQTATINSLNIQAADYGLSQTGTLDYSQGLAFLLDAQWYSHLDGQQLDGSGPIEGDLERIKFKQTMKVESTQLQGEFALQGQVNNLQLKPEFDLQINAADLNLMLNQQSFSFKDVAAELRGDLDDYHLVLNAEVSPNTINNLNLPASQIKLQASGNSEKIATELAQITTPEGLIDLQATIDWSKQLHIQSQLKLTQFNPQQLLQAWPGMIDGTIDLDLTLTEQGLILSTQNNSLTGQLKGQVFALTGSANYASDTFVAEQLSIELGANHVLLNGTVNEQTVAMNAVVDWVDLSVIDDALRGQLVGSVEVSGHYTEPEIKTTLNGQQITYADYQVNTLTINSQGQWNKNLVTVITAENATLAGQLFEHITVNQTGWLADHEVELMLENNEVNSRLNFTGQYDNQASNKQAIWQGQINSHELTVDTDKTIKLQAPIAIKIADRISIAAGCWQGVEAGTLCVELNDINQTDDNYQGSLTLDAFSLKPLQVFLPDNIKLNGKLQGVSAFQYHTDDFNIESKVSMIGGEILVQNEQETVYQSSIKVFEISAKTTHQNVDITINTELADDSTLKLQARLENPNNQGWLIDSTIEGMFYSTELIKNMSDEIKELAGQIKIGGSINGPLVKPNIQLNLSQPDGYLVLTRLGTLIENLQLNIGTECIQQPVYTIELSGNNLASLNQGQIASSGKLKLSPDKQWQYSGDITGENFMLLNLPEAKFNITPALTIKATHKTMDVTGDLTIDSGHVTINQLPPSSISNSNDLEIHTTASETVSKYPISMNINAKIKDPIKLDVIGLNAGLMGSIQLVQQQSQSLAGKGTLTLSDGSYEIYGQKLDISQGELLFTGPLDNPRLNVKASRKSISGDVIAGVELGGTVNNLQSNLFSEPSLSDIEKLSYIMTGRGIDNSGSLNGEQLKQAAIVMGLNQSSPIFNQIQSQFGIDVLTLRESAVAADTVVEAGKKINDKLYVSYNQGLFNRLGFWMLKYRINQFLNLETTQGEDQSIELVYTRKAEIKKSKKTKTEQ
ncbi:translocation/assembly module TamB domain-containing protein [Marinicella litoralis]|uniref:translocation/assembly module TamB domain-containing protein n=1 Tax=Marinicella litoralis TaxID=644220 RepID=UPI0015D502D8|nr:translocation/assembly module TamB domain-containing protein [Marinicella litoralis]